MKNIIILDLSWKMHAYKHSLSMLTIKRRMGDKEVTIPTGHVYGVVSLVTTLAETYDMVILAVDSHRKKFKEVCPEYKSGRHSPTGDPIQDYNIYLDLIPIIQLCTSLPNVYYIKENGGRGDVHPLLEDGLEADHIIQSFIADTNTNSSYALTACFNDNDTLRKGNYLWLQNEGKPPLDKHEYVQKKYNIDLDYVPSIQSILHGQTSDNFPPVFKGISSKVYSQIMMDLKDSTDPEEMISYLTSDKFLATQSLTWRPRFKLLLDKNSQEYKTFMSNFTLVNPVIVPVKLLQYKKQKLSRTELVELFNSYQINYNKSNYFTLYQD